MGPEAEAIELELPVEAACDAVTLQVLITSHKLVRVSLEFSEGDKAPLLFCWRLQNCEVGHID